MMSNNSTDQGLNYPVTIGTEVSWYPKSERWRIEVVEPSKMTAVWISHDVLSNIIESETRDPDMISDLVQAHRTAIEEHIGLAEMESWKNGFGVLPQGIDGYYQR